MKKNYSIEIEKIKKKFIHYYMCLTIGILIFFIVLYKFFIVNTEMVWYLIIGVVFLSYTYNIIKNKYTANRLIKYYLILAPIYNFYILLTFWDNSLGSYVTLFPIPIAAYIFFSKKEAVFFALYATATIVICFFVNRFAGLSFPRYTRDEAVFCDIILFTYNLTVLALLFIFNDKIKRIGILSELALSHPKAHTIPEFQAHKASENPFYDMDRKQLEDFIERLKKTMETEKPYRDPKLDITKLSTQLEVSYSYLSKVIRIKGYKNFNNYINQYRIEYVKTLLDQSDLQKVTLMYIYTEAGFTSQSTFNRVFKQFEGITPSEYISNHFGKSK
ncbi:helix-turn-helix domain-containing protein [Chryseobacterium sp. CT-SW4]|uniref:helix-turn-helix domain-containing protein n=1 Tax=Chryseobacterium sp. SW-1 TaxID=3157343 RepID=UPI003B02B369